MSSASSPASTKVASSSSTGGVRRQRVLWDSDSVTRGGKTSIGILLEWLAAPGNYARWRDGKSQTGETREALCSEIKNAMRRHGIHHRANANIRTQISELERSFDAARSWLKENELDPYTFKRLAEQHEEENNDNDDDGAIVVDAERSQAEAHVLRVCRYYPTLNEVFGQDDDKGISARRGCQRPFLVKKRKLQGAEDDDVQALEPKSVPTEAVDDCRVQLGGQDSVQQAQVPVPIAAAPPVHLAPAPVSAAVPLAGNWTNLESTQRMLAEAVREERERKRFCMEEERNKLECEKLRCEVEAAKLKLTIDRALARKKLLDAGLPEAQVNELFPK
ncbi:hypothetical protein PF010_g16754 [Phytophthora fragariae]|uniref:Uncharacterized protein n=1 Tax=Phytophthora fragariae TaxID=53985 RepID=A0A6G0NI08_9STRA|nr:hypothetical protein PF010_g16754 [Phytophthora fragariae]KAE9209061.1 hypothetical protein PF004_g16576 [Phytophthora fragariae]KAE9325756.1 hypothetical protein PF008_g16796 [Phytophthora fragariae]